MFQFLKELKYVKKKWVILVFCIILCIKTQKCQQNTIIVKKSYLCIYKVFYEKNLSRLKILYIQVILHYALKQ